MKKKLLGLFNHKASSNSNNEEEHGNRSYVPRQSVSSILNNPLTSHSYFDDLKYKLKKIKYEKAPYVKKEDKNKIKKIEENFSFYDIIPKQNEEENDLLPIREYIKLDYNNYINRISSPLKIFSINHPPESNDDTNQKKQIQKTRPLYTNNTNNNTYNNNHHHIRSTSFYFSANGRILLNKLDKNFQVDEHMFRINNKYFTMPIADIQQEILKHIEFSGLFEMEIESLLKKNNNLFPFIADKFFPLYEQVEMIYDKISVIKQRNKDMKHKYLYTHSKFLLTKTKQQNKKKILNELYILKKIHTILKDKNFEELNDAIEFKNKLIKVDIKRDFDSIIFEMIQKHEEIVIAQFIEFFNKFIQDFILVTQLGNDEKYNADYYQINEELYNYILSYERKTKKKNNDTVQGNSINLIINNKIRNDELDEKLNNITLNETYQNSFEKMIVTSTLKKLNEIMLDISDLKKTNKILFLFYVIKICDVFNNDIILIFKDKFVFHILTENIQTLLMQQIEFIFDMKNIDLGINDFNLELYLIKQIILVCPITKEVNINKRLEGLEREFIGKLLEITSTKIHENLKFDNFTPLENFPENYQFYVDKICSFSFDLVDSYTKAKDFFSLKLQNTDYLVSPRIIDDKSISLLRFNQKENSFLDSSSMITKSMSNINNSSENNIDNSKEDDSVLSIDNELNITNQLNNNLSINKESGSSCKIMITTLSIISFTFDILRLFTNFSFSNFSKIISSLIQIYKMFLEINDQKVLNKTDSTNQTEISLVYSNIIVVKNFIQMIKTNDKKNLLNQITNGEFNLLYNEFWDYICKLEIKAKKKITDLIKIGCIQPIVDELSHLDFINYPVIDENEKLPINPFALNLVKMIKGIVTAGMNSFDTDYLAGIIEENLLVFAERVNTILAYVNDTDISEEGKKQFKKDFVFIKKNISNGLDENYFDFKNFKKEITKVYKRILGDSTGTKTEKKKKKKKGTNTSTTDNK